MCRHSLSASNRGLVVAMLFLAGALVPATPAQQEPPLPSGLDEPPATQPAGDKDQQSDEPALPAGLGGSGQQSDEPGLPSGLGGEESEEPDLPAGLGDSQADTQPTDKQDGNRPSLAEALNLTGFWEVRAGVRTQQDDHQQQASMGETRVQLEMDRLLLDKFTFRLRSDLVYDAVLDRHALGLERGEGFLDLREVSLAFTPVKFLDVKVGRQVLTWGTGDLLFLNDMFPKDWQSFFIGRDVEYLKAPSDAAKLAFYSDLANWDLVYTPRFDADRFINGRRISYYSPLVGGHAGYNYVQQANIPNRWFEDDEWAMRVWKNVGGIELAAYGYWGYWKSPAGQEFPSLQAKFPRLNTYGASVRGSLAGGIANAEVAYYDSSDDREGRNRFVNNSEMRFLVGYERQLPEIADDLTVGGQYYVEWMMDYDAYRETLLPFIPARDELRHVVTLRLTKLLLSQNLELSLFTYFSPSDSDAYLRPQMSYKIDDHWTAEVGGNVFVGAEEHTFFGQFANNTNVYFALRYGF